MPVKSLSGTDGLYKDHNAKCDNKGGDPTKCNCRWRGRHRGITVPLAKWGREKLDPRSKTEAKKVLARFVVAVDKHEFDARGEKVLVVVDGLQLRGLIDEWKTHYAAIARDNEGLSQNSLDDMLGVLQNETTNDGLCLGSHRVLQLIATPDVIKEWLDTIATEGRLTPNRGGKTFRRVKWGNPTWNRYLQLLNRVCAWAVEKKRIAENPCASVPERDEPEAFQGHVPRLLEEYEQALFDAVEKLNEPRVKAFSAATLTFEKAEQIRARVAKGELQSVVADELDIARSVVCDIVNGRIWTSATYARSTKGDEMRRRLIAGFDAGLRVKEMMLVQVKHVDYRFPKTITWDDGTTTKAYKVNLPAKNTKSKKQQYVWAATERFVEMLDKRRFIGPEGYVFGKEDGGAQKGYRSQIIKLFKLADLPYGREIAQTWHTTRHEFISRMAERTKDTVLTKELARHANIRTTERYMHGREDSKLAAIAGKRR